MKPLRFLLESYVLCIFLELFVPWMKALTEELTPESLTKTQKVVSETFDKASFVVAFFAAGSLAHLLLGKKRFSYGKAISLFSYCWGAPNLLLAPVGLAAAWIIDPHPGRTVLTLLTAIVELVLGFGLFFYQIAPIAKVYKQNWVKTVGVSVLAIIVFVAVNLIAGSIEEWIVPRLPDLVH